MFSGGRGALRPLPGQKREGGSKWEHKSSNRSGKRQIARAARKPGPARSSPPCSRCCHLDSSPLPSSPLKTRAGGKGGGVHRVTGREREAPGPARKQIRSHWEGGRPTAQLRRLPRLLPFRDEAGGRTIPSEPGAPRRGGARGAAAARRRKLLSACAPPPPPSTFLLLLLPCTSRAAAAAAQSYRHTQGAST